MKSVDQKNLGITGWLEYFTDGALLSIAKVKEKVLQLSTEKQKRQKKGQIALSESQMRIIELIHRNGRITSGEIQGRFKISRRAAHKELKKLIELDIIQQKGTGRATYYVLK